MRPKTWSLSAYEQLLQSKRDFHLYGILLIGMALLGTVVLAATDYEPLRYVAFTTFILGMYCTSLANFQHRLATLQAALDMKRMVLDMKPKNVNFRMRAGQEADVFGQCVIRAHNDAQLEIIRK